MLGLGCSTVLPTGSVTSGTLRPGPSLPWQVGKGHFRPRDAPAPTLRTTLRTPSRCLRDTGDLRALPVCRPAPSVPERGGHLPMTRRDGAQPAPALPPIPALCRPLSFDRPAAGPVGGAMEPARPAGARKRTGLAQARPRAGARLGASEPGHPGARQVPGAGGADGACLAWSQCVGTSGQAATRGWRRARWGRKEASEGAPPAEGLLGAGLSPKSLH